MTNRTDKMQQTERKEWNLRPLTELNLIEDFLTNQMLIHPVVGLRFSKRVLTTILGREIGTLSIAAQKAYPGENTDRHGIRLDVCLDEQGGDIVDLEPDQNSGAKTLFLYTKGTEGNPPEELRQLLHYMEDTRAENAVTPELRELHEMVTQVKCDKEVGLAYMKAYELEQRLLRQGREEGRAEGLGIGEERKLLNQIIGKLKKGKSIPEIAEALDEDEESISRRVEIVGRYAPEYDLEAILGEVIQLD